MPTASKRRNPNKLGDKEKRKERQIKSRVQKRTGRDNAERIATGRASRQVQSGHGGGGNRGGEPQKKDRVRGRRNRSGSKSNASK